jgi:hypothetical protein
MSRNPIEVAAVRLNVSPAEVVRRACDSILDRIGVAVLDVDDAQTLARVAIASLFLDCSVEEFVERALSDLFSTDPMLQQPLSSAVH